MGNYSSTRPMAPAAANGDGSGRVQFQASMGAPPMMKFQEGAEDDDDIVVQARRKGLAWPLAQTPAEAAAQSPGRLMAASLAPPVPVNPARVSRGLDLVPPAPYLTAPVSMSAHAQDWDFKDPISGLPEPPLESYTAAPRPFRNQTEQPARPRWLEGVTSAAVTP